MKTKNVYVSGYFKGNLGDDLFLQILINRYKDVNFYIMADASRYRHFGNNLKIFNLENRIYNKIFNIFRKKNVRIDALIEYIMYRLSDYAVKIGGSLFMEDVIPIDNLKSEYNQRKYYILGANVGPFYTDEYKKAINVIFENSADVCLRDIESYNQFKQISHVRYAPDIAFQLDVSQLSKENRRSVCISVIDLERVNYCNNGEKPYYFFTNEEKQYYYNLIDYIIEDYHRKGFEVNIISFCVRDNDSKYAESLAEKYQYLNTVNYDGNIFSVLMVMSSASVIFATRFHAMILGFLLGKVTIPIVYSEKTTNVMKDLGYKNPYYDISHPEYGYEMDLKNYQNVELSEYIYKSQNHFFELDKVLKQDSL